MEDNNLTVINNLEDVFTDNLDKIIKLAESNTVRNKDGLTVLTDEEMCEMAQSAMKRKGLTFEELSKLVGIKRYQ